MAEIDTLMLAGQHSDIRREAAEHTNEIVKEGIKEAFNIRGDVKDSRFDVAERVGNQGDRIVDRIEEGKDALMARSWDMGRDTQDIRAQIVAQQQQVVAGFLGAAKDVELCALKSQLEAQKNTAYLSDRIGNEGDRTRALIHDLKYHDLNRGLIERQTALVNCEHDRHHYRDRWLDGRFDQGQVQYAAQWAQLQNQVQAFQSQLQETRQGMVNFGTMSGQSGQQTSTANNVR